MPDNEKGIVRVVMIFWVFAFRERPLSRDLVHVSGSTEYSACRQRSDLNRLAHFVTEVPELIAIFVRHSRIVNFYEIVSNE